MMVSVLEARHVGGYRIWLRFNTGETGEADLEPLIRSHPIAAPLHDPNLFHQFFLDEWPTLAWPCGYDVAPETLYMLATGRTLDWLGSPATVANAAARSAGG